MPAASNSFSTEEARKEAAVVAALFQFDRVGACSGVDGISCVEISLAFIASAGRAESRPCAIWCFKVRSRISGEARKFAVRKSHSAQARRQIPNRLRQRNRGHMFRRQRREQGEVDLVGTHVRRCFPVDADLGAGQFGGHDFGQLSHLVVAVLVAGVDNEDATAVFDDRPIAHSMARAMSATSISGRHGVPSLSTVISPVASALATKSLSTRSRRSRSDMPQAVAKRRQVTVILPALLERSAFSIATLERA